MSEPRDDDEKVSALMRSLPQQPLPPGFMQRLERRRAEEERAAPRQTPYLLPFPARVAAFALSCLIVSLVVYDKAPQLFPSGALFSGAAPQLPSAALSEADVEQARARGTGRRLLRARGEPLDSAAGAELERKVEAQRAALSDQLTNEQLQAGLEREKKKLGVKRIAPPPPPEVVAEMRRQAGMDAEMLRASPPAPMLGAAGTPALLASDAGAGGASASAANLAAAKPLAVEKGGPAAPAAEAAAPAAPAAAEGLVLRSADERAKAWSLHGMHAAPPTVNFKVNMIALAVAPDLQTAIEVIGVSTRRDAVVVRYRLFPRLAEVASTARSGAALVRAYQFRVIPRTDKPVVFQRVD